MKPTRTKDPVLSRRSFLAGLGLGSLGMLVPGLARAAKGSAQGGELATLHDLSKCVGCGACVEACREAGAHKFPEPAKPFPAMVPSTSKPEDWSEKRDVTDRLTPYTWLFVQNIKGTHQGRDFEVNMPRRCMHCQNPPCASLCPWGAAEREKNGVVSIDPDICLGGAKCKTVCPWQIPQRQSGVGLYLKLAPRYGGNGVMYKCDRCRDRLAQGGQPACVEACPYQVQEIGPREEMLAKARALAKSMGGYIYGETENGGTNTFYVSPVPFEALDAAAAKGPGRPHLERVGEVLADERTLAAATLLAPLAGVVAGVLRLGSRLGGGPTDGPDGVSTGGPSGGSGWKPDAQNPPAPHRSETKEER